MRIFYYYPDEINASSGNTRRILDFVHNLRQQGHTVYLFSHTPAKKCADTVSEYNTILIPAPNLAGNKVIDRITGTLLAFLYLIWYALKLQPKILYVREPSYAITAAMAGLVMRCPVIMEVHEPLFADLEWLNLSKVRLFLLKLAETINFRLSARFIAITEDIRQWLHRTYKIPLKNITHIETGANPDIYHPMDLIKSRETLGLQPDNLYIGFVGLISFWSGLEILAESARMVIKEIPNVKFIIVGSGPTEGNIHQQVISLGLSDKFIFAGRIEWSKVPIYVNAFDVAVAPYTRRLPGNRISRKKSCSSLKVFEYMACAKPVVVTEYEGPAKVVRDSECGLVVPIDRPDELAKSIVMLLKNPALRQQMGINGRNAVMGKYEWKHMAYHTGKVFLSILNK